LWFPSRCNVIVGIGLVLMISVKIEGQIPCITFPSWFNVVFGNALVLVLKGNLTCVRFCSWCNGVSGNALVLSFTM
jgi:hypothetical protein